MTHPSGQISLTTSIVTCVTPVECSRSIRGNAQNVLTTMANSNVNFVGRLTLPNYRVVFREEVLKGYVVLNCRTPEEAEGIAQDMHEDGEDPDVETIEALDTEVEEIEDEL